MELLTDPHMWVALATLTVLELVLGIDNIIFISILVSKLPKAQQEKVAAAPQDLHQAPQLAAGPAAGHGPRPEMAVVAHAEVEEGQPALQLAGGMGDAAVAEIPLHQQGIEGVVVVGDVDLGTADGLDPPIHQHPHPQAPEGLP